MKPEESWLKIANLTNLDFDALDISSKNYLPWILNAEIHLDVMGDGNTIKFANNTTTQEH